MMIKTTLSLLAFIMVTTFAPAQEAGLKTLEKKVSLSGKKNLMVKVYRMLLSGATKRAFSEIKKSSFTQKQDSLTVTRKMETS